jgi:putative ABC transport system permease protein
MRWRVALRVARREALRAKGRAALVVAMILIPVAALAFLAVAYDSFTPTPSERADRMMGTAQAVLSWSQDGPVRQDPNVLFGSGPSLTRPSGAHPDENLLSLLPAGTRVITDQTASLTMHTVTGTGVLDARLLDYADPLAQGMFRPLTGRAPASAEEIALTPAASARLGAGVGATVALAAGSRTFRIVGTVENPESLDATTVLLRPGALPAGDRSTLHWLAGTPGALTWTQVKELNTHGVVAVSRYVLAHPPATDELYPGLISRGGTGRLPGTLTLVGGLAMLEVVLLAGPAFAVSARRRRRDLALVAASGATPGQVRGIVLADGVVLGAVAAVTGTVLGAGAAILTRPLLEDFLDYRSGALRIFPVALLVLIGLAVLTGVLAALVPAWISGRQDVVTALAGRRGITRSRKRWVLIGGALAIGGTGIAALGSFNLDLSIVLLGLIGFELGLVLCTPALVGLVSRVGRRLPVAARIALRDTSRNRTAAAPAISAVMAAVVGSLAIAVVIGADYQRSENAFTGRQGDVVVLASGPQGQVSDQTVAAVRDVMPVRQVHLLGQPTCPQRDCFVRALPPAGQDCPYRVNLLGHVPNADEQRAARRDPRCDRIFEEFQYFGVYSSDMGMTVIIEPDAVGTVANISDADAALAAGALRAGEVVVDEPRLLDGGRVRLSVGYIGTDETGQTTTAPGFVLPHRPKAPLVLMTADTATHLGFGNQGLLTLASTTRMPTTAEQDRLRAELGQGFQVQVADAGRVFNQQLLILAIVAGVIVLAAAALATGLLAADGRADLGTLAAVGASPRVRRMLSLSQSGVIAGLGSLLGAIPGLGASTAVLFALNQRYADSWPAQAPFPITVPWLNLAAAVIVVPAIAMLGAGLLTRSRLPIERRL